MKPEDQQYYKDQHAESQKKYEIDLAAYKQETKNTVTPPSANASPAGKKSPVKNSVVPLAAAKASPAAKASSAAKKIKDPNEPKKPMTAYQKFSQDQRLKMKAEGQKINLIEFTKE